MAEVTQAPPEPAPSPDLARKPRFRARSDSAYWIVLYGVGALFGLLCIFFLLSVISESAPAWNKFGLSILYGTTWNQATGQFGAVPLIIGTVETTIIALALAVPIGVGTALAIVHVLPARLRTVTSSVVELLAAVPSVVYGLWGFLVLGPWFADSVEPHLQNIWHGNFPFQGQIETDSLLLAGCVLFVMILPLVVALSRDAILTVPHDMVEGALSVGATRWQVFRKVVLPSARTGIVGAITLATARALGETVAVAMVIGLNPNIAHSLYAPSATIASIIATEFQDSTPIEVAALCALAVILMGMTLLVNVFGRWLVNRAAVKVSV
jgi:phosphate transport system permease protein